MESYDFLTIKDYFKETAPYPSIKIFGSSLESSPDFSIVIPAYKRIDTLEEAIESALNQNGKHNYELVVVCDNPVRNDNVEKFMEKYRDNQIISFYKNTKNLYIGGNWMRCYELAKAPWVILLHDDDLLMPDYLNFAENIKDRKNIDGVFVKLKWFKTGDDLISNNFKGSETLIKRSLFNFEMFPDFTPSAHLIRKDKFYEIGGFEPLSDAPDLGLIKLIRKGRTYITTNPYAFYRQGDNNSTLSHIQELIGELVRNYKIKVWPKLGIPKFLIKKVIPYCDFMAEKVIRNTWNKEFNYLRIKNYTQKQIDSGKKYFRWIHSYFCLGRRITNKKLLISINKHEH